jgi:outer membrane protein TolC
MDTELPFTVQLEYPEFQIDYDSDRNRPELMLFQNQLTQIDASSNLLKTKRIPKFFAFGQVGYGRPGLNFLNDEFDTYYLVGAKLSWNLFDWNQNKRERKILAIQKDRVVTQRDVFNERINIEIEKKRSEGKKYEKLIVSDNEIINLRKAIVETSSSKFDNGVITSTDYLNDLNAEKQARINRELHNVKLMKARADYIVIKGKKDEGME